MSLTPPLSLWPAAPVMAGPSSSTWDRLQEQLARLNDLVLAELSKGEHYNQGLVEAYKQEREILGAQIRQMSGDSTMFMGLCCVVKRPLPQAEHIHQHAYS